MISSFKYVVLFVLAIAFLVPTGASAKTVTSYNSDLPMYFGGTLPVHGIYGGYQLALYSVNLQVTYEATITNLDTGTQINDGATVPVGTNVRLAFRPHQYTDIYWFGSGGATDSPYGEWREGGAAPSSVSCEVKDKVNSTPLVWSQGGAPDMKYNQYAVFSVDPPEETITNTSGLTCQAAVTDSGGNVSQDCVVASAGTIAPHFNVGDTAGKFYGRYDVTDSAGGYWTDTGCVNGRLSGTDSYMTAACGFMSNPACPAAPMIGAQTISFSFTAVQTQQPPVTPTITGSAAVSCTAGVIPSTTYSFNATDPNGDQIKYGLDWDNSGTVDQWIPSTGYVPSGTSQSISKQWTAGTFTFRVLAQDTGAANSAWATKTVTVTACPPPAPTATLTASPNPVTTVGGSSTLTWSCSGNTTAASINQGIGALTGTSGASWSGTKPSGAISAAKTFTLTCTGPGGTTTDDVTVGVPTTFPDLTATGVTPNAATVNVAQSYTANVPNNGTANTNAAFSAKMQQATSLDAGGNGVGVTDKGSVSLAPIAPSTQRPVTLNLAFPTVGTVYLRVCADSTNEISESNEGNNCGAWSPVVVSAVVNPTATLTCTPPVVAYNGSANIAWSSTNATTCTGTNFSTAGALSGSVATGALTTSQTYSLTCTGASGTTPATQTCTVTAGSAPNLTASDIPSATVAPSTSVNLTSAIGNTGGTASGMVTYTLFQRDSDSNHTSGNETAIGFDDTANVPALGSINSTKAYTFTTNTYVRACADAGASASGPDIRPNGLVAESDEVNNCGNWTLITVSSPNLSCSVSDSTPDPDQTITFSASPNSLGSSAYTWDPSNGSAVASRPSTYTTSFSAAGTYSMTVSASGYSNGSCSVTVNGPACSAKDVTITAGADLVEKGQTTTLTWDIPGVADAVNTCTIKTSVDNSIIKSIDTTTCTEDSTGTITSPPITGQTTFTLTCGTKTDTVVVSLIPGIDEF